MRSGWHGVSWKSMVAIVFYMERALEGDSMLPGSPFPWQEVGVWGSGERGRWGVKRSTCWLQICSNLHRGLGALPILASCSDLTNEDMRLDEL